MKNFSGVPTSVKIAAVASVALILSEIDASAAEVRFLCADALESSMRELIPQFEKSTGHSAKMTLANAGTNTERLRKGDLADLAIVLPQQWETLHQEGKIDPAVRVVTGKVGLGAL
jgi:molybdate transport system substrate-binding protein